MQVFFAIAYFLVGLFQFFAVWDGTKLAFSVSNFVGFIISCFLTYIPLVGSAFGVYGAHNVWEWGLVPSILLFFWYVPVYLAISIFDR
jgi:hypothetical protein